MSSDERNVEDIPFTKQMRKATRGIHNISDALINAKLGIALSDDEVWAEGLLIFYDIFAYLEAAMDRLADSLVGELDIEGMRRTQAFQYDLSHYLGSDWQDKHQPRPAVREYLEHLEQLEQDNPHLLMAYIYHLYMGMLSGGQILRKKRQLIPRLLGGGTNDTPGNAVTNFEPHKIGELKRKLASAMDRVADMLDDVTRQQLIEESREVFVRNNQIVETVRGTNQALLRKFRNFTVVVVLILLVYLILFR